MTTVFAIRRSPCHREVCCGGPARVWCPRCGASYQADDPRLTVDLDASTKPTIAEQTDSGALAVAGF